MLGKQTLVCNLQVRDRSPNPLRNTSEAAAAAAPEMISRMEMRSENTLTAAAANKLYKKAEGCRRQLHWQCSCSGLQQINLLGLLISLGLSTGHTHL